MMSREAPLQNRLFEPQDLGARIPDDHLLRRILETIDLDFVYDAVEPSYGAVGQGSVPPTVILKSMLLMVLYKVESEREFFRELPMRIDWLWFLGYDLFSTIPNHSVLSKARRRWGVTVFEDLFGRTIRLCLEAHLISGQDLLADSSLIDANASVDSLFVAQTVAATASSKLDEECEKDRVDPEDPTSSTGTTGSTGSEPKYRSTTDPDATGAKRRGETRVRPRYQTHRAIDSEHGVITATCIGPGHENEAHRLEELVMQHAERTGIRANTVTADSKYGTADNLEFCEWNHITAFISPYRSNFTKPQAGWFSECCFRYDAANDCFICPAGQMLTRSQYRPDKDAYRYRASRKVCQGCVARAMCTSATTGRSINRQVRQPILDRATARIKTAEGKAKAKLRRWRMEGSFARSVRFGYKRARARGLRNMRIQDYLVAAAQNLLILLGATARIRARSIPRLPTHVRAWSLRMAQQLARWVPIGAGPTPCLRVA